MKLNLQIITPEKVAYKGEVDQVTLPAQDGEITILANHIPLISVIKHGKLVIKNGSEEIFMAVWGGFVEVKKNDLIIMTNTAERSEEIDEERAQKARECAEKLLAEKDKLSDVAFADATAALERSLMRLNLAKRRKKR